MPRPSPVFPKSFLEAAERPPPKDIDPTSKADSEEYKSAVKKHDLGKFDPKTQWFKFSVTDLDPASKEFNKLYLLAYQRFRSAWNAVGKTSWWVGWKAASIGTPEMVVTKDSNYATAWVGFGTGGRVKISFNVDFILNISIYDIAFVIIHEALHFIFDHLPRMKGKEHVRVAGGGTLWNIVTDAYINEYLIRTFRALSGDSHHHLDYALSGCVRWSDLPKALQKDMPVEDLNDYTVEQIYYAFLEYVEKKKLDLKKKPPEKDTSKKSGRAIMPVYEGRVCQRREDGSYHVVTKVERDEHGNVVEIETQELPGYDPKNPKAILEK